MIKMSLVEVVNDFWPILGALFGAVIWLVRLEGKVKATEKDISSHEKRISIAEAKHNELYEEIYKELSQIKEHLALIRGSLKGSDKEI